jgi:hypothetical protein
VIIENQYGWTDHLHLGQIMTYAGGTKPSTIVWVAEQFREEHRAALDWLNAHTDPTIRFFGVRLAAVTLEGAPAGLIAPSLELVVKPNDWEKQASVKISGGPGGSTPTQVSVGPSGATWNTAHRAESAWVPGVSGHRLVFTVRAREAGQAIRFRGHERRRRVSGRAAAGRCGGVAGRPGWSWWPGTGSCARSDTVAPASSTRRGRSAPVGWSR